MKNEGTMKRGDATPWGPAHTAEEIAPGIWHVTTGRHGGYKADFDRCAGVRSLFPHFSAWNGHEGWFEEDSDWAFLAMTYPDDFTARFPERKAECLRDAQMEVNRRIDQHAKAEERGC